MLVVLLGVALFGLTLTTWATGVTPTMVGAEQVSVTGSSAVPGVASAGLVVLVSGLVLGLSGRLTRILAVLGVLLGGALATISAVQFLLDPESALLRSAAEVSGVARLQSGPDVTVFPVVSVAVAVLVVIAALLLPFSLGRWTQVGRRYEVRQLAAATNEGTDSRVRAMDDWDALSRGVDPSGAPGHGDGPDGSPPH